MTTVDEPKIDCHCHIFDPVGFPYTANTPYMPAGQEIATAAQMGQTFAAHGVRHALIVQPNSGYGEDNRCLLSAIAASAGRYKGIAVVPHSVSIEVLAALKAQGVLGVAFNVPFHGVPYYLGTSSLIAKLAELDMFLQIQVERDQLLALLPGIEQSDVKVLIDHCGRPDIAAGLQQPAFQALLALGRSGRAVVKLSGTIKFSAQAHPFEDTWPFVRALVDAFTLERCVWGSDWPFLRAPERVDYGPLLVLIDRLFPSSTDRRRLLWDTPQRLFGFSGPEAIAAGTPET
jgi:predicted TIM-barrel fold metal-dependent hydrolase